MINGKCWIVGAACLLALTGLCRAATPEASFDSIYGSEVKGLEPKDMAAFAGKLIGDAGKLTDDPALAGYLLDKAYEYFTKGTAGPDKTTVGQQLLFVLVTGGDASKAAGKTAEAGRQYQRALAVATAIGSDRLAELQAKVKETGGNAELDKKARELVARYQENPDDPDLARAVVMLYVIELDRPADAVKYAASTKDATLEQNVKLAGGAASQPEDSKRLGDWYRGLAHGANVSLSAKAVLLGHAKTYYEKFLTDYSKHDGEFLAAKKGLEDIAKEFEKPAVTPVAGNIWGAITNSIANKEVANTEEIGRKLGQDFQDQPQQGYLIGFRMTLKKWFDTKYVVSLQPIFMTRGGVEQVGAVHGKPTAELVVVKAKSGYAVSAVSVESGLFINTMRVTFAKVKGTALDPSDTYLGEPTGNTRNGGKKDVGSSGNLVIGITGKADDKQIGSIGLIYITPK